MNCERIISLFFFLVRSYDAFKTVQKYVKETERREYLLYKCICVSGKKIRIPEELVLANTRSLLQHIHSSSINQGRERPVKLQAKEYADACRQRHPHQPNCRS